MSYSFHADTPYIPNEKGCRLIWHNEDDEEKVKEAIRTKLRPSSLLCIGYPEQKRGPKSRRKLRDLIHVV